MNMDVKNHQQNTSRLNIGYIHKVLYSMTKWDLSQVCKVDFTFKNILMCGISHQQKKRVKSCDHVNRF